MGKTASAMGTLKATGAFGGPAWVLSAVLHASVAAAVFAHPVTHHEPKPMEIIEIVPALESPPPVALPEPPPLPTPPPTQVAPPVAKAPPPAPLALAPALASATPSHSPAAPLESVSALTVESKGQAPAVVTASGGPTFVMALPVGSSPHAGPAGEKSGGTLEVIDERAVSRRAAVAYGPVPVYPRAARAAQVETDVPVEIIVNEAGSVIDARVMSHLGYGLEEATLDAIRQYRFTPAQRDGHPVAVRMIWTMQYRLQ